MVSPLQRPKRKEVKPETSWDWLKTPVGVTSAIVVVVLVGVLLSLTGSDKRSNQALEDTLSEIGIKHRRIEIVCDSTARRDPVKGCHMIAKGPMNRGEVFMKIPTDGLIDGKMIMASKYTPVIGMDNTSAAYQFFHENRIMGPYANAFAFGYYFAMERRAGSESKLAGWIQALPSVEDLKTVLFWDKQWLECVDTVTRNEGDAYLRALNASTHTIGSVCAQNDEASANACAGGPLSEEELKWGMSIWMTRNFQEQAVPLGFDFLNHNIEQTAFPQWNQEESLLDVKLANVVHKGQEITTNYLKPPQNMLLTHGFYDPNFNAFHVAMNFDTRVTPLFKKHNCDRHMDVAWTVNGRPKSTLVNCAAILIATPEERKSGVWKTHPRILMNVYGNLTVIANQALDSFPKETPEQCNGDGAVPTAIRQYAENAKNILSRAVQYCDHETQKYREKWDKISPPEQNDAQEVASGGDDVQEPAAGHTADDGHSEE